MRKITIKLKNKSKVRIRWFHDHVVHYFGLTLVENFNFGDPKTSTVTKLLLIAGLGPYIKNSQYIAGTLLDPILDHDLENFFLKIGGRKISLDRFRYIADGKNYPILRTRRGKIPHLSAYRLRYILEKNSIDYDFIDLEDIWYEMKSHAAESYNIVALSTTFILPLHYQSLRC